jgi:hypothetical protein
MIITDELARRLEYAEAVDASGCVDAACRLDPSLGAATAAVAGGFLTFCGPESPLTHAVGTGMHGPVTPDEVREIEQFFQSRGAPVAIDICPHADPTLRDILSQRGYRMTEFNNVLVRKLPPSTELPTTPENLTIRAAEADDVELYAATLVRGFFGRDEMTEDELTLGRLLFLMPSSTAYMAFIEGEAVGAGSVSIRNGVANLFGDATLSRARGRRVQSSLIAERLRAASAANCDIAIAGTQPGSVSQGNYEKLGFQVAYSKVTMVLDA